MWWWILVWAVLLLAASAVMVLLGWRVLRQLVGLGRQLSASGQQISDLLAPLHEAYQPASSVLADPASVPTARPARHRGRPGQRRG